MVGNKSNSAGSNLNDNISLEFFGDTRISGLLGGLVALSGELLVLKAHVKRLEAALEGKGIIVANDIQAAGDTQEMSDWMAQEANVQMTAVLRPMIKPDEIRDIRKLMLDALKDV